MELKLMLLARFFSGVLLATSLIACAETPSINSNSLFITDTAGASIAFQSLRIEGSSVKGQIRRLSHEPIRSGHIEYAVISANGIIREQGQAEHGAGLGMRHSKRNALFSIPLHAPLATGEKIKLTYQR
jgi:hypothetical protein